MLNKFIFILSMVFFSHSCDTMASSKKAKLITVEYIGETDKAPPKIIFGTEKYKTVSAYEQFFFVSPVFMDAVQKNCVDIVQKTSGPVRYLKITLKFDDPQIKKEEILLSDAKVIRELLKCLISNASVTGYHSMSFNLERILEKIP
jgi:hypothetical protein